MQNDATLMHLWFMISFEAGKIYSNLFDQAKKNAPAYSIIASNGYIIYFTFASIPITPLLPSRFNANHWITIYSAQTIMLYEKRHRY